MGSIKQGWYREKPRPCLSINLGGHRRGFFMEKIELVRSQFKTSLLKTFKGVEPFGEAHVNIALSVSKEGLPARFLAGVIPGFALAQAIQEQFEVETSVRFFTPINIAITCNGSDREEQFRATGNKTIDQGI